MSPALTMRGTCYPVDTESVVQLPVLTDAHRAWLNDPVRRSMLTWRFTVEFAETFGLDGSQAGKLIAIWAKELA